MNRQILHDPDSYTDPLEFSPERFLGEEPEPDPREIAFGYGRRICECFCFVAFAHLATLDCALRVDSGG